MRRSHSPRRSSSGSCFIALSLIKLGFLANFLSKPILVGFVGGGWHSTSW